MKKIFVTLAIASLLIGGTVVYSLGDNNQGARQTGDSPYAEATEQGMMGQHMMGLQQKGPYMMDPRQMGRHMMGPQAMGMDEAPCWNGSDQDDRPSRMGMMNHMMGPYAMDGSMSGMLDRMDDGPMGLFMMEQQPERDFYLDRVKELNLSADQVSRLKEMRLECRKDNLRSASEATIARLELANLLSSDNWSLKEAEALVRKVQQLETDIQVRHLQAAVDARSVLTPKQLAQVKADVDLYDNDCHFG